MWSRKIDEPGNVGCYCILEGLECLLLVFGAHLRTKRREAITFFFFKETAVTQPVFYKASSESRKTS